MSLLDQFKTTVWNIGFIDTPAEALLRGEAYSIRWMRHSYHDRFFADPFVEAETDTEWVILAEEYVFALRRGRIVRLTVRKKDAKLLRRKVLISTKYHLSYPFVWGDTILPEQSVSGKWIAYDHRGAKADEKAALGLVDATVWHDGEADWVFACRADGPRFSDRNRLYRYRMIGGRIDPSSERLVKTGDSACRPGGSLFTVDGHLYRPAQDSTDAVYGESVTICKVLRNDDTGFSETPVRTIHSHNETEFRLGLHTFSRSQTGAVVDGFDLRLHPVYKLVSFCKHKLFKA